MNEIWICHVCGDRRPDHLISVHKTDRSDEWKLPPGTLTENVRYCSDRPECAEGAPHIRWYPRPADDTEEARDAAVRLEGEVARLQEHIDGLKAPSNTIEPAPDHN